MQKLLKAATLLTLLFLIRLAFSCCDCPEQPARYQFDYLRIQNLDNSTWSAQRTEEDVMEAAAVAFEITLTDSTFFPPVALAQNRRPQLNSLMAMEPCWCPYHFFLKSEIIKISILTLLDFAPERPAGSEITDYFVYQTGYQHLYQSIDSLIPQLNEPFYGDFYPEKIQQFFCRERVQNDSLQLVFELHYGNGDRVSDTTHIIAISTSEQEGAL